MLFGFFFPSFLAIFAFGARGTNVHPRADQVSCDSEYRGFTEDQNCPSLESINTLSTTQPTLVELLGKYGLSSYNDLLATANTLEGLQGDLLSSGYFGSNGDVLGALNSVFQSIATAGTTCRCNLIACNNALFDARQKCTLFQDATSQCHTVRQKCDDFYTPLSVGLLGGRKGSVGTFCCNLF